MNINKIKIIDIPKIKDERGSLSVLEKDLLPFKIKRVYYLYDVPSDAYRGGHAHIEQWELLIAISGSFNVVMKNTNGESKVVTLNKPNKGLLIPNMVWRELEEFSSAAICLVVASDVFMEKDYIRKLEEFF